MCICMHDANAVYMSGLARSALEKCISSGTHTSDSTNGPRDAHLKTVFSDAVRWKCSSSIVDQAMQLAS